MRYTLFIIALVTCGCATATPDPTSRSLPPFTPHEHLVKYTIGLKEPEENQMCVETTVPGTTPCCTIRELRAWLMSLSAEERP